MNPEHPNIISTDEPITKNKFPILIQLSVLGVILLGIFGAFLFHGANREPTIETLESDTIINLDQVPVVTKKLADINIRAKAAYVWDVSAKRALFDKNAEEGLPLASITKLMTALLSFELVTNDDTARIPKAAIKQEGSSGLSEGERLKIDELRELALVSSSNDAAYALAASVGVLLGDNDPTIQFVQGMNIRAEELGLDSLHFWNTTGLDLSATKPGAIGSARDISFLMEYIVTNYPEIISPTTEVVGRVYNTDGAYHNIENTNEVVSEIPNLIGSKTGFTDLAGGNLTVAFDIGLNHPIIITVLGSTRDERFTDVMTLVNAVRESQSQQ